MRLMHLCLCGPYSDDYEYQDNLLPLKHYEMGYEVKVLVSQETWEADGKRGIREAQTYINKDGYEITVLPFKKNKFSKSYRLFDGLYDEINKYKPDIIFCHGGLTYDYKNIIKYLKENPNVRFYLDSHVDYNISGMMYKKGINYIKRFCMYRYVWGHCIRRLSKYANKVWGVTPIRVEFLKNIFKINESKVDLLVMGGDERKINYDKVPAYREQIRRKCGVKDDELLFITGGKLDKYKNIPNLIKALNDLTNVHLAIFGSPDNEMRKEIEELTFHNQKITMLGWSSSEEITKYYLGSDFAIFPGRHSVLWEQAVLCGIPCAFLYAQGMQHVDVGGNCLFFEDGSVQCIKDNILKISNDRNKLENMRKVAQTKGKETFSYINIAKKSIEVDEK